MHPLVEVYSRVYLTAIGMSIPDSKHEREREDVFPTPDLDESMPHAHSISIFTWLKSRLRALLGSLREVGEMGRARLDDQWPPNL